MALVDLLNLPVTIVRRTMDDDAFDPVPIETTVETQGELQQTQRSEPVAEGELSVTTWLLVLPAGTVIDTGDGVIADGDTYEVIGDPAQLRNPRTQEKRQVEATLLKTGGEEGS